MVLLDLPQHLLVRRLQSLHIILTAGQQGLQFHPRPMNRIVSILRLQLQRHGQFGQAMNDRGGVVAVVVGIRISMAVDLVVRFHDVIECGVQIVRDGKVG